MNWLPLAKEGDLERIIKDSHEQTQIIFKHSTRCAISAMAKSRLQLSAEQLSDLPIYLLDLIANRELSNEVARQLNVKHESPQIIVVRNGESVYDASHLSISAHVILKNS